MVVSLHGATLSAASHETQTGLSDLGSVNGFITVFPQARADVSSIWDARPRSGDVQWVATLIRFLHANGCSAPGRTFVTGFSMGAMMAGRLACGYPRLTAGIGMVAGTLPPVPGCRIPARTRVMIVHGRDDDTVPFDGSMPEDLQPFLGGPALSDFPGRTRAAMAWDWAQAKGCPSPRVSRLRSSAVQVTRLRCPGAPVTAVIYTRSSHEWNSEDPVRPTSRRMVQFFGLR